MFRKASSVPTFPPPACAPLFPRLPPTPPTPTAAQGWPGWPVWRRLPRLVEPGSHAAQPAAGRQVDTHLGTKPSQAAWLPAAGPRACLPHLPCNCLAPLPLLRPDTLCVLLLPLLLSLLRCCPCFRSAVPNPLLPTSDGAERAAIFSTRLCCLSPDPTLTIPMRERPASVSLAHRTVKERKKEYARGR